MTGLIRIALIYVSLCWLGSMTGCARIYCWYSNATAPKMTSLDMFEWQKFTKDQHPSGSELQIEIRPTESDDKWLLLDWDSFNPYASRAVVVSDDGTFLEYSDLPDVLFAPNRMKFIENPEALKNAGVSVKFDYGEYSRYLEPEAWGRAIVGYPLLTFKGKTAGRIIEGDYWYRRLHCYPPRAKISVQSADGSITTTLYELSTPDKKLQDNIGASISADERFLYIYVESWGGLIPLNRDR